MIRDAPTSPAPRQLSRRTLRQVFWRSLFLQAAWNPKGMQNLGFAYALYPALAELYPDAAKLAQATERHLCCFNSHPYFAATIVGGAVHHEERIAQGEEPPEAVNAYKQSLMGPLAALGDGFFWLSLRPACGAVASLVALGLVSAGKPLAAALAGVGTYLVSYNAVHLAMRARFFAQGYLLGDAVVERIAASRLAAIGQRLRVLATVAAGAAGGLSALALPWEPQHEPWAALGAAGLFAACHGALAKGISPYLLAYAATALALCFGLFF
ncbi:MAG: PTS system mannose/fructose/sorbose family transporter subunit IID [Deltaproteobacteria bacterium]|nr:PTS system mannose/fructose/sorbose family transporter subunit IID [Deltaproteobacteria bacterium]